MSPYPSPSATVPRSPSCRSTGWHPAPWNPRTIKDERFQNLCRSIQTDPEFLWRRLVLANIAGEIFAGNMRYRAAEHLGFEAIPAILDDITEHLAKQRAPRDNAQWEEWEEWEEDELAKLIASLALPEDELQLLGFQERDRQKLVARLAPQNGLTDPDDIPEAPEVPITQPGDLWLLGDHRRHFAMAVFRRSRLDEPREFRFGLIPIPCVSLLRTHERHHRREGERVCPLSSKHPNRSA